MTNQIEDVIKHAVMANHDGEVSSIVILMVTKGREPEMHMGVAPDDVHQMNTSVDILEMEMLRIISANSTLMGKRE